VKWLLLAAYVALLFLFPFAYQAVPNGFFFSPQAVQADIEKHRERLIAALDDSLFLRDHAEIGDFQRDGIALLAGKARVAWVDANEAGDIKIRVTVPVVFKTGGRRWLLTNPLTVTVPGVSNVEAFVGLPSIDSMLIFQRAWTEPLGLPGVRPWLLDSLLLEMRLPPVVTVSGVNLSLSELRALNAFVLAKRGDPHLLPRGYPRFLYLSAVTITTLGFGDIVPVNDTARLLVGAESVLGVLLAGLFLNAAFGQARRSL